MKLIGHIGSIKNRCFLHGQTYYYLDPVSSQE